MATPIAKIQLNDTSPIMRLGLVDLEDGSLVGRVLGLSIGPVDRGSACVEGTARFVVVDGKQQFVAGCLSLTNRNQLRQREE